MQIQIPTDRTSGTRTRATQMLTNNCRNMFDALNHCATAAAWTAAKHYRGKRSFPADTSNVFLKSDTRFVDFTFHSLALFAVRLRNSNMVSIPLSDSCRFDAVLDVELVEEIVVTPYKLFSFPSRYIFLHLGVSFSHFTQRYPLSRICLS